MPSCANPRRRPTNRSTCSACDLADAAKLLAGVCVARSARPGSGPPGLVAIADRAGDGGRWRTRVWRTCPASRAEVPPRRWGVRGWFVRREAAAPRARSCLGRKARCRRAPRLCAGKRRERSPPGPCVWPAEFHRNQDRRSWCGADATRRSCAVKQADSPTQRQGEQSANDNERSATPAGTTWGKAESLRKRCIQKAWQDGAARHTRSQRTSRMNLRGDFSSQAFPN